MVYGLRSHQRNAGRGATVFFVSLSTPLNLLSDCRRARCGQDKPLRGGLWPSLTSAVRVGVAEARSGRRNGLVSIEQRNGGLARWLSAGFPVAFVAHHGVEDHE